MSGTMPKYREIYNALKLDIYTQKYKADSFLPTEEELMEIYGASKTTIRHAILLLKNEKLIEVQQGRGTQVLPSNNQIFSLPKYRNASNIYTRFLLEGECTTKDTNPVIDLYTATPEIAQALEISTGDQVYRLQRLRMVNGRVFAYKADYLSCDLAPGLDKYNEHIDSLYELLKNAYGILFSEATEYITSVKAGFQEANFLEVEIGSPLLLLKRYAYCSQGPMEYSENFIRPDLYEIAITLTNDNNPGLE